MNHLRRFSAVGILAVLFFSSVGCNDQAKEEEYIPASDPLFVQLAPENTGITFSNTITEDWDNNILSNSYLYNGGGVAILDANGDGLDDIYFTATQGPNALYLNRGNWQFEDVTASAGLAAPEGTKTGVSVVDINEDGYPDLYVTRTGLVADANRKNLLFINDGKGIFSEQAEKYGLADQSASNHANFFDFDQDGDLDVYVINYPTEFKLVNSVQAKPVNGGYQRLSEPKGPYESDRLYENRGDTFVDVTAEKGLLNRAWGLSITAADINADGYTDLYIGNDYIEPDQLLLGQKGGGFVDATDEWLRHMSNHTMGVDIADLNRDGKPDLVTLDMLAPEKERYKTLMTTMIQERYNSLKRYGYKDQVMRNTLQFNTGNGFTDQAELQGVDATDWSWAPLVADFDLDGSADLFITNGYRRDVSNLDYLNYTYDSIKQKNGGVSKIAFPDYEDYAKLIPTSKLGNYAFRQNQEQVFENVSHTWGIDQPGYSNGAAYADLDQDGDLDLIINNLEAPASIYRNQSREKNLGNYLSVSLSGPAKNKEAIGAKVKLVLPDGTQQLQELRRTRGFLSAMPSSLFFGIGNATQLDSLVVIFPDGKAIVKSGIAANTTIKLVYEDASETMSHEQFAKTKSTFQPSIASKLGLNFKHVENEFEDFSREPLLPRRLSRTGPCLAVGDVNGDGLDDIFVGGAAGQAGKLFFQTAKAGFSESEQQSLIDDAAAEDTDAIWFDADGDGDLDLYVVSGGSEQPEGSANYLDRLYINTAGKLNRSANTAVASSSGSCVVAFDADDDGDLDLFVGGRLVPGKYPSVPRSFVLQNQGGTFVDATMALAPGLANIGMVTDAVLSDLAGDGKPELVLVGEWMPVTAFAKTTNGWNDVSAGFGFDKTTGLYNCVLATDQNKDGKQELVFGNLGLNNRLETPLHLYWADFDINGQPDPILAYEEAGKIYPYATRDALIKQLPMLRKNMSRYRVYARSDMQTVFGERALADTKHVVANVLASSYWTLENRKLSQLGLKAQMAPLMCAAESPLGIILGGNDFDFAAESGRQDASNGELLLPDNSISELPFQLKEAVRDMATVKLATGKHILVVANNNAALQAFALD